MIEDFNTEVRTIKYLATTNAYEGFLVDKLMRKHINKQPKNHNRTETEIHHLRIQRQVKLYT